MARAADAQVAPFGATRAGVTGLVPEARLIAGDTLPVGKYGVTEAQVDAWLDELSGVVSLELDGWERLSNVTVTDLDPVSGLPVVVEVGDRDRLVEAARTVVHNGAASYLEAARHPERSSVNDTSYAGVLWARYRDGLDRLTGWLAGRLAALEAGDELPPEVGVLVGGTVGNFPAPLFGDGLRF